MRADKERKSFSCYSLECETWFRFVVASGSLLRMKEEGNLSAFCLEEIFRKVLRRCGEKLSPFPLRSHSMACNRRGASIDSAIVIKFQWKCFPFVYCVKGKAFKRLRRSFTISKASIVQPFDSLKSTGALDCNNSFGFLPFINRLQPRPLFFRWRGAWENIEKEHTKPSLSSPSSHSTITINHSKLNEFMFRVTKCERARHTFYDFDAFVLVLIANAERKLFFRKGERNNLLKLFG